MSKPARPADAIREALKPLKDPELGLSIVDLGLIYDIRVKEGKAHVLLTLTTPGCPLDDYFRDQIIKRAQTVDGVDEVDVELTFDPPWGPDKMDPDVRAALGFG